MKKSTENDSFIQLDYDPTKTIERKTRRSMRKIKNNLTNARLYPTGTLPGKFYNTVKQHKLKNSIMIDDRSLRPSISNIGTTSHQLAKCLVKLLAPLNKAQSTKEFIDTIKNEIISSTQKMIPFDVSSLFTMVPQDYIIDVTLKQIYGDKEIETRSVRRM